jgi:hypothetical protein
MAITPEEAERLTDAEHAWISNQELYLDATLRSRYEPGESVVIALPKPGSPRATKELVAKYVGAGWEVRVRKSDNARLEFKAAPKKDSEQFFVPPGVRG